MKEKIKDYLYVSLNEQQINLLEKFLSEEHQSKPRPIDAIQVKIDLILGILC